MDAMIGLDVMPVASTEDPGPIALNPGIENTLKPDPHQESDDNLMQNVDVIDLTIAQGTSHRPIASTEPSLVRETMSINHIPITNFPIVVSDDDKNDSTKFNDDQRLPPKHKLPITAISPPQHQPPKVPRIDFNSSFAVQNSNPYYPCKPYPISNHQSNNLNIPPTVVTRNHTVTSREELQLDLDSPICTASANNTHHPIWPFPNEKHRHPSYSLGLPAVKSVSEGNFFLNEVPLQTVNSNTVRPILEERHAKINPMPRNPVTGCCDLGQTLENEKRKSMFYKLLDMFPDIELTFLENKCRLSWDINVVSDIILEMGDYPKEKYCHRPSTSNNSACTNLKVSVPTSDNVSGFNSLPVGDGVHTTSVKQPKTTSCNLNQDPTLSRPMISPTSSTCHKPNGTLPKDKPKLTKIEEPTNNLNKLNMYTNTNDMSQFNFLMEIFPDADPIFMESVSKFNETELRTYIAENMEKPNYPKFKQSEKLNNPIIDDSAEIGLYTSNFNLGHFLKIFPDPFQYFLDQKRKCKYSAHGFEFMKRRYRCHALKTISLKYKEYEYNLVRTCEFLDAAKPTRVSKRTLQEIKMPEETNLPFLQEACFIEHQIEIKTYLDGLAEAKRVQYEQAEACGELIECGCCYQNVLFEDCTTCNEGHLFCKPCVQKSVEVRIGDALTTFPCLQDCDSHFSLQLLETLVDATMFSRLLQRIQFDEVRAADIEGLEVCPFCDFAIILPPETNIFKCLNPECLRESCRKCHRISHIPLRCEEVENDDQARARKYIEDEMTRALIRICYKCKKSFIKTDGCNKMTCSCGAKMCYICRQPIQDYMHFNGPGGDQNKKCPLYSTEKLLHVDAVTAVAKKALEEVTSKNPELKLKYDPSTLLPSAKSANTSLPPGVNEEADRMLMVLNRLQEAITHDNIYGAGPHVVQPPARQNNETH
ncbi:uncharacterized protein LOC128985602 [Macrosteles quadrilineatus]|uniref:uncharacterized protein LOC128985602 n=1 Tax=Macrosteles quadrilineatus TaxID=74068 RepID=UPI0023E1A093|nr:uncharacterized protein LOC128985602 [Macrosteles quadrilineatus]